MRCTSPVSPDEPHPVAPLPPIGPLWLLTPPLCPTVAPPTAACCCGRAERLDGMARMLAGLEWPFVIRRPDELRTALHEHVQWLVTAYGRPFPSGRAVGEGGESAGVDHGAST
jgi:hypothetical protein